MTVTPPDEQLSPMKRAILELRDLRGRLAEAERWRNEPIAITGMACRFPGGANTPEAFWKLLYDGVDAIREVPQQRWDIDEYYDAQPGVAGKMYVRHGGFVEDFDRFDPQFFGISPREAESMDPQQRMLLETAWEALERAGQAPDRLMGSRTGVFVGAGTYDYVLLQMKSVELEEVDPYFGTGGAFSATAGRLSYVLGLQGPSMTVDTACSSSLVAIHLACQSLRHGECRTALAAGVNLVISPGVNVCFCQARMLAPDGRCKTFDASADGYSRGEGCGVLVLKRLSDARADGDNVLAVIRGSAVNQDGRSGGLTVPNGPAQESLLRDALASAGLRPADVGYVEAHGTGTTLGDPIEVKALSAVLREERSPSRPLAIGSVKTNIGHLEAAAGVASMIKVVLSLQHGIIPPHLHFKTLNPHISLSEIPGVIPTERMAWPEGPRIAGVSSFGFTGTNAHVLVEAAPAVAEPASEAAVRPVHVLTLSARTESALSAQAARLAGRLRGEPELSLADVAYSANTGRAHFSQRLALSAESLGQAAERLEAAANGATLEGVVRGEFVGPDQPEIAFLFTGQGSQYAGMGRQLYDSEPTFRKALDQCAEVLRPLLPRPLLDVMHPAAGAPKELDETLYTQPALFALEWSLAELWRSWGIEPQAVMGHSVGEYVAACVAGVFGVEDALKLIAARGRLMQALPAGGAMAAVLAREERVREAMAAVDGSLSIAAVNGPESVVVSGPLEPLARLLASLESQGLRSKRLTVSHAFHSELMAPMLAELEREAGQVAWAAPRIALVSNLTGRIAGKEMGEAQYWSRHAREAVRFADGMQTLSASGYHVFVEIGPSPILVGMGRSCLPGEGRLWLPSLRPPRSDWSQLADSAARLYVAGAGLDWTGFDRPFARRKVLLPTYPFAGGRYWSDKIERERVRNRAKQARKAGSHALLGRRLRTPSLSQVVFENELDLAALPYLKDHRIQDTAVVPAATYLEMAVAAAREAWPERGPWSLEQVGIEAALAVPDEGSRTVQVILAEDGDGTAGFEIVSAAGEGSGHAFTRHATGRLREGVVATPESVPAMPPADVQERCAETVSGADYYERLKGRGFDLGPAFRAITQLVRRDGESLAELRLPLGATTELHEIHPVLFDACCHAAGASFPTDKSGDGFLVLGLEGLRLHAPMRGRLWSHARLRPIADGKAETITGDVRLFDDQGRPVATLEGLQFKRARRAALGRVAARGESFGDWLYDVSWPVKNRAEAYGASSGDLLGPAQLAERLAPEVQPLVEANGLELWKDVWPEIEALSSAYVVKAFRDLGWDFEKHARRPAASLAADLGVLDRHRRLLARLVSMLEEDGVLRRVDANLEVVRMPSVSDPAARLAELQAGMPMAAAELNMVGRCGARLGAVLKGDADPLALLFPGGSTSAAEQIYQESPGAKTFNGLVQKMIAAAIEKLPAGKVLRILEVGAGTGGTTASVLPILPADRTEYVFTDVSAAFTDRAAQRFQAFPFVRYRLLDVERDPAAQGVEPGQFDLVLAVNVLHATRSLRDTLQNLRKLLAPQGLLAVVEATRALRWLDITFGMTEGWWRFMDEDVRKHPLLPRRQWLELLGAVGFEEARALPEVTSEDDAFSAQALLVARAPQSAAKAVAAAGPKLDGDWLILADRGGVGERVAERVRAQGGRAFVAFARGATGAPQVDPRDPEGFVKLWNRNRASEKPWRAVLHLWSLDAPAGGAGDLASLELAQVAGSGGLLHLVQAGLRGQAAPIWVATRGTQAAGASTSFEPAQAPVWGLGRVVSLEHPELWGGLVDLDDAEADAAAARLLSQVAAPDGEDQIAWRGDQRHVARLTRAKEPVVQPVTLQPAASYLIVGGLGRLGLKVAQSLVEEGARHLVLMSRRGLPAGGDAAPKAEAIAALEAQGATVEVVAADVGDRERMTALIAGFGTTRPALRGVVHAAVSPAAEGLAVMTLARLQEVYRPKVSGAFVLQELTAALPLDFFVLFSSTTGLLGVKGLGHYAGANTYLDTLAHSLRAAGRPAIAINWGVWDDVQMGSEEAQRALAGAGLRPMPTARALRVLQQLTGSALPQIVVAAADWSLLKAVYEAKKQRPFLEHVANLAPPSAPKRAAAAAPETSNLKQRLAEARPQDRYDALVEYIRGEVRQVLRLDAGQAIELQRGLFDLGLDSLMSVELKSRLEAGVGRSLPSTLTFNYPNVGALADYLAREVLQLTPPETTAVPVAGAVPVAETPVAVGPAGDELSEDELAAKLSERLGQMR